MANKSFRPLKISVRRNCRRMKLTEFNRYANRKQIHVWKRFNSNFDAFSCDQSMQDVNQSINSVWFQDVVRPSTATSILLLPNQQTNHHCLRFRLDCVLATNHTIFRAQLKDKIVVWMEANKKCTNALHVRPIESHVSIEYSEVKRVPLRLVSIWRYCFCSSRRCVQPHCHFIILNANGIGFGDQIACLPIDQNLQNRQEKAMR